MVTMYLQPRGLLYRFVKAIKETAIRFGFDPTHFAGYSPRVGGASLLRAAGASDGFLKLMGRSKTLPACLGYQETSTKACDLMLALLDKPDLYTERDIRLAQDIAPEIVNRAPADDDSAHDDTSDEE